MKTQNSPNYSHCYWQGWGNKMNKTNSATRRCTIAGIEQRFKIIFSKSINFENN